MFGYVTIEKNELKIREYDIYQAYYCGICKSVGRRFGQLPRMALNYDVVFLALILSALSGEADGFDREHCIVHPIKKKPAAHDNRAIDYGADVLMILTYHKFLDDWKDEKSAAAFAGKTAFSGAYKKLKEKYPEVCSKVEDALNRLSRLEEEKSGQLDLVSDTFGELMECLFEGFDGIGENSDAVRRTLGYFGKYLGRWIYVIDALDDYEKDRESSSYNPLIYRKNQLEGLEDLLYNYLAEMTKAYDLLEIKKNQGLIENIIFMGLRSRTDALLGERNTSNEQSI